MMQQLNVIEEPEIPPQLSQQAASTTGKPTFLQTMMAQAAAKQNNDTVPPVLEHFTQPE